MTEVVRTDIATRYYDSSGEMQLAVRQRPDTEMWVMSDWATSATTTRFEEFEKRSDAEAAAKRVFKAVVR